VDGRVDLNADCILGLDRCNDTAPCALHDYWKRFREQYFSTISDMTLEQAALSLEQKRIVRLAM
jgi:DNA-binding IscR family transcriptional regulator